MKKTPPPGRAGSRVHVLSQDGRLTDILVHCNGRDLPMLGPAGQERELSLLPGPDIFPGLPDSYADVSDTSLHAGADFAPKQSKLPVLIGSGTGVVWEATLARLQAAFGPNFLLAVVDKEHDIQKASGLRERAAKHPGVLWISAPEPETAVLELTRWQILHEGKAFIPLLNPFYLRLDRGYYSAVNNACQASSKANFWEKAHYAKFRAEETRLLLITSKYFLMGEITSACERLQIPYHLLQLPEGELGQNEFIEQLLNAILEFKPDFIFTINHLGVDREGVLSNLLARLRLPLASWFVDNPHLILSMFSHLVNPWIAIFTWDSDNIESLKALGFDHVSYLPLGVDTTRFLPRRGSGQRDFPGLPRAWNRDIAFVGNSMRYKVLERLARSRMPDSLRQNYQILGEGFAKEEERSAHAYVAQARPDLLQEFEHFENAEERLNYEVLLTWEATLQYRLACIKGIMPLSPLIVGDRGWHELLAGEITWHYHKELNYYSDLPSFYPCAAINFNCTSKQMKGAVNQRVFDVPATESFLLTDYREQMERLFEPGREIVCYHSPEEALDLAQRYISRPADRLAVAKAARQRILREHRYEHRLQTLIAAMRRLYGG